jgi:hypothetical protein
MVGVPFPPPNPEFYGHKCERSLYCSDEGVRLRVSFHTFFHWQKGHLMDNSTLALDVAGTRYLNDLQVNRRQATVEKAGPIPTEFLTRSGNRPLREVDCSTINFVRDG